MSISKAAGAPVIFLKPSFVDKATYAAGGLTTSTMQDLAHRLYQMDPAAIWQGSAGADDAVSETITAVFYAGSLQVARTIDTLMILNNNLDNFVIQYSIDDGASWTPIVSVTGNAGADYVKFMDTPLALPAGAQLQVQMNTTYPANQDKFVGNFIATLSLFQLSRPPIKYTPTPNMSVTDVELADKTIDRTHFCWSDTSFILYSLAFEHDLMPKADRDNMDSLLALGGSFLCYPEPGDEPRKIYLCVFEPETYKPDYTTTYKGSGYNLPFDLKQVGYA